MSFIRMGSDGLVNTFQQSISSSVQEYKRAGITPKLVSMVASENTGVLQYEKIKAKVADTLSIAYETITLDSSATQDELEGQIHTLRQDPSVHGIMIAVPTFNHLNFEAAINRIPQNLDVDGLTAPNVGLVAIGRASDGIVAATPMASFKIASLSVEDWKGKRVTVVGAGRSVGSILTPLLTHEGATVTTCNEHTPPNTLMKHTKLADVVFSATGCERLLNEKHFREGQIIVDIGVGKNGNGDIDIDSIQTIRDIVYSYPTKDVGPLTTRILFSNLMHCIELQSREPDLRQYVQSDAANSALVQAVG